MKLKCNRNLILAIALPKRQELFNQLEVSYSICNHSMIENRQKNVLDIDTHVQNLAQSKAKAVDILQTFSNETQIIVARVNICDGDNGTSFLLKNEVTFYELSASMIQFYVTSNKFKNKIDKYSTQPRAVSFVKNIAEDDDPVMRPPLSSRTYDLHELDVLQVDGGVWWK